MGLKNFRPSHPILGLVVSTHCSFLRCEDSFLPLSHARTHMSGFLHSLNTLSTTSFDVSPLVSPFFAQVSPLEKGWAQPFVVSLVLLATCCSQLIRMSPTWEQCLEYVPSSADVAFDSEHEKASLVSGFFLSAFVVVHRSGRNGEWGGSVGWL